MESPVIVPNYTTYDMPVDNDETGFPFDDSDYDTRDHLQSALDSIAQRHPDLANRINLDSFGTFGRNRHNSGSEAGSSRFDTDRRFGDRSFPSNFNRFPFTSHFDNFTDDIKTEEKPPEVPRTEKPTPRGRKPTNPNLPQHLSNTVDLGQKQAPVEENRTQRSMSAPPENRSTNTTATNTKKIENDLPKEMGNNRSRTPTNPQPARERIIPIQVEGREELLIPKNTNIPTSKPQPEPERVFSGEPDHFYQQYAQPHYSQPSWQPFSSRHTTSPFRQTQQKMPSPSAQRKQHQQSPQPQSQQSPQPQHQQSPQPQFHPEQEKPVPPPMNLNDPLEKIKSVKNDVLDLMQQVEKFVGTRKDKLYIYLDEMLTRNLIKLDDIETEGKDNIRTMRKEAIKCIQECINKLEAKAQAHEKRQEAAGQGQSEQPEESPQADQTEQPQVESAETPADTDATRKVDETVEPKKKKTFKTNISIEIKPPGDGDVPMEIPSESAPTTEPKEGEKAPETPVQVTEAAQTTTEPMELAPSTVEETPTEHPMEVEPTTKTETSDTPVASKTEANTSQ